MISESACTALKPVHLTQCKERSSMFISRFTKLFFAILLFFIFVSPLSWAENQMVYTRLAIMPFKNLTGDNDKNWLGEGISDTVATELGSIKGLILIERSQLAKAVEELKLSHSGLLDEKTAIKVGKLTSAKYLVVGSYQMAEGDILMNARLIDVESGGVQQTARVKGSFKNIFELQDSLAKSTLSWINITPSLMDIQRMKEAPTSRNINVLEFISRAREAYYAGRTDESEEWIKKTLAEDSAQPDALLLQGNIQERKGQYSPALGSYTSAAEIFKKNKDEKGYSKGLRYQGSVLNSQGKNNEALRYYDQSLAISRNIGDETGIADALMWTGNVYIDQSRFDEALPYFNQSLDLYRKTNDERGIASALQGIGRILSEQERYDEALAYYNQSLAINIKHGYDTSGTLLNIAGIYYYRKQYYQVLSYYNQVVDLKRKIGDEEGMAIVLGNTGKVLSMQGRYEEALDYFTRSINISRNISNERALAYTLWQMGDCYLFMRRNSTAKTVFLEAATHFEKVGDLKRANHIRNFVRQNLR